MSFQRDTDPALPNPMGLSPKKVTIPIHISGPTLQLVSEESCGGGFAAWTLGVPAVTGDLDIGAAASLREGLDETFTVKRLKLGDSLEKILSATNSIENLIGTARYLSRRVKRWRGGTMVLRWVCTAMDEATKKFRRVRGHTAIPRLLAVLQENDRRIDAVDNAKEVA